MVSCWSPGDVVVSCWCFGGLLWSPPKGAGAIWSSGPSKLVFWRCSWSVGASKLMFSAADVLSGAPGALGPPTFHRRQPVGNLHYTKHNEPPARRSRLPAPAGILVVRSFVKALLCPLLQSALLHRLTESRSVPSSFVRPFLCDQRSLAASQVMSPRC